MDYEITVYNFFVKGDCYTYIKDGKLYVFSAEMFACMKRQYIAMGYRVIFDNDRFVSFSKVENENEVFELKWKKMVDKWPKV